MGFDLENIDALGGAMYMGAGGSMPSVWLWISVAVCVIACVVGSRHELDAYKKIKK